MPGSDANPQSPLLVRMYLQKSGERGLADRRRRPLDLEVPPRREGVDPRPEGLHASRPSDAEWTTPFEGASLPAEGCCRADVEVPADPGVEEDETPMGCDSRTLKQ